MAQLVFLVLLIFPTLALANVGLPMLAVAWPLSAPAFIPVVIIESWVVRRALGISWSSATTQMLKANFISTLVGIPLAWVISVAAEFSLAILIVNTTDSRSYPPPGLGEVGNVILTAPWLGPINQGANWILPLAMIVLLVPFFLVSFWIEAWYVGRHLCPETPNQARLAIWKANAYSYTSLFIVTACWLIFGLLEPA
jgi:hypothetical protein